MAIKTRIGHNESKQEIEKWKEPFSLAKLNVPEITDFEKECQQKPAELLSIADEPREERIYLPKINNEIL